MRSPRFIVGVDGSEASRSACRFAAGLADAAGALVRCVFVRHIPAAVSVATGTAMYVGGAADFATVLDDEEAGARAVVDATIAGSVGYWDTETREGGDVAATLEAAARDWGADVVIVGNPGRHGVHRLFGSVATHLVARARVPVLVVPPATDPKGHGSRPRSPA